MKDKFQGLLDKFFKKGDGKKAADKRVRIFKAQQQMMLVVAATSVIFGVCLVLCIHFIQYMLFNGKVLAAEDESIASYGKVIKDSGACVVADADGKITSEELLACNPDKTPLSKTVGSLRYNVLVDMAKNENLESVARKHLDDCYDNGKLIDYTKKYEQATSDSDRELYLSMVKMCSALRVIPDALPAQKNDEALLSSLNEIFILSDWQPESLSPGDEGSSGSDDEGGNDEDEDSTNINQISSSLAIEGEPGTIMRVLQNVERSIRTFQPTRASISWSGAGIDFNAQMDAFYTNTNSLSETDVTISASKKGGE